MTDPVQKIAPKVEEIKKEVQEIHYDSLDSLATEVRWIKRMVFALWAVVFVPKFAPVPAPDELAHYAVQLLT